MRKPWKKGAAACTAMLLFLFFAFSVQAASLLSDRAISNVTGGVIHPFAMDPVVVYVENQSRALHELRRVLRKSVPRHHAGR